MNGYTKDTIISILHILGQKPPKTSTKQDVINRLRAIVCDETVVEKDCPPGKVFNPVTGQCSSKVPPIPANTLQNPNAPPMADYWLEKLSRTITQGCLSRSPIKLLFQDVPATFVRQLFGITLSLPSNVSVTLDIQVAEGKVFVVVQNSLITTLPVLDKEGVMDLMKLSYSLSPKATKIQLATMEPNDPAVCDLVKQDGKSYPFTRSIVRDVFGRFLVDFCRATKTRVTMAIGTKIFKL